MLWSRQRALYLAIGLMVSGCATLTRAPATLRPCTLAAEILLSQKRLWYECGLCHDNVWRLLSALQHRGFSLENTQVVVILHKTNGKKIHFVNPAYDQENWEYHVLALNKGRILDVELTNPETLPTPRVYFEHLFGNNPKDDQKIGDLKVRLFSGQEYLSILNQSSDRSRLMFTGDSPHETDIPLLEFLERFSTP
jgi:hypothetical protein